MVVLSRKCGESIIVGDGVVCPRIEIKVTLIGRGKARLGIEAPREVPVVREEVRGRLLPRQGTD